MKLITAADNRRKRARIIPCLCLLVLALSICAGELYAANPEVRTNIEYYEVSGSGGRQIRKQLNKKGPKGNDRKRYDAFTGWTVEWNFAFDTMGPACFLRGVGLKVDATQTLPKWVNKSEASPALQKKWDNYFKELKAHEDGHTKIAVDAANEIKKKIGKLPPQPNCAVLTEMANAIGDETLEKYRAMEAGYDKDTDHGKKTGAEFP